MSLQPFTDACYRMMSFSEGVIMLLMLLLSGYFAYGHGICTVYVLCCICIPIDGNEDRRLRHMGIEKMNAWKIYNWI